MQRVVLGGVAGLALACSAIAPVVAVATEARPMLSAEHVGRFAPHIVNGTMTAQYPTTGALLDSNNFNAASMICSGTLIGCQTFLTAGHCVDGNLNPSSYSVFLQHAGFFGVSSITMRSDFNFPVGDVAVIKLSTPVTGIAPTPIDTTTAPSPGTPGVIVGFGRSGGGISNADYGLKRVGSITTAACVGGVSNTTSVCWNFTNPLGPPGSNSDTCNGDSGGPLLIDSGGGMTVAGVTSGGTSNTCLPTDNSYDANVFHYHAWIDTQGGADLNNTSCGSLPQVGQPGTNVQAASGTISAADSQATHTFEVPAGTTQLRVAMNAIDDGSDFDLYVNQGSPPTTGVFDCKADGSNQYGFCQFNTPTPGTWYAMVRRFTGSGAYQLTVTTLGTDCSSGLSNGLPCDDGNACTQNDGCQAGTCAGTAVADGTPCDDGNVCTQPDTCQVGSCTGGNTPLSGCIEPFVPQRGMLRLEDKDLNQQDKLTWNWMRGSTTTKTAFGDPVNSTDYTLCMFDQTPGTNAVIMATRIPAGGTCGSKPCWKDLTNGFKYSDRDASNGGVKTVLLNAGGDGKAHIIIKGNHVGTAAPLPLRQQSTVRLQLSNGTTCWEARYSTHVTNSVSEFKAKPD